ncbi:hypothetical protein [Phycicoccus duodecadis]|nr:hypothetical protein [Phycicoccus duodecadis]
MRTSTRALMGIVAVLATTGAATLTAGPATADVSPRDVVAVGADGSTTSLPRTSDRSGTMDIPGAFPVLPTAVSDGLYYVHYNTGGTLERLQLLSVVGGALELTELRYLLVMVGDTPSRTAIHTALGGHGWGSMRLLTDAAQTTGGTVAQSTYSWSGRFYGIGTDGVLRRYTRSADGRTVRSAGAQPGFTGVRTMALYSTGPRADVLLVTTTNGALSAVTVPTTGPGLSATSTRLRTRGWGAFEALHSVPAASRTAARVVGVDADTHTAHEYGVGALRGTSTTVTTVGPWTEPATDPFHITFPRLLEATPPGG